MKLVTLVLLLAVTSSTLPHVSAVTKDLSLTFESGDLYFTEGASSPNPPVRVATGGRSNSAYVEDTSTGGNGAGSKWVMYTRDAVLTGDYVSTFNLDDTGSVNVTFWAKNFGAAEVNLRVGFERDAAGTATKTEWVSTTATTLASGSEWTMISVPVVSAAFTRVTGNRDFANVLADVYEFRIISSAAVQWRGDAIATRVGVDDFSLDSADSDPSTSWASAQSQPMLQQVVALVAASLLLLLW